MAHKPPLRPPDPLLAQRLARVIAGVPDLIADNLYQLPDGHILDKVPMDHLTVRLTILTLPERPSLILAATPETGLKRTYKTIALWLRSEGVEPPQDLVRRIT